MSLDKMFLIRKDYADQELEYWMRYKADEVEDESLPKKDAGTLYETTATEKQIHNFEAEIVDNRLNWALGKAITLGYYEGTPDATVNQYEPVLTRMYRTSRLNVKVKDFGRWLLATGKAAMIVYQPKGGESDDIDILIPEIYDCAWTVENGEITEFARRYVIQEDVAKYQSYCDYYTKEKMITCKGANYASYAMASKETAFNEVVSEVVYTFGMVPAVIATTDECARPAFYPVITLIDAYNNLFSEATNQFNTFAQSYLILTNYMLTNDDLGKVDTEAGRLQALEKLKKLRVLLMDDNGKAEFLKREVQVEAFDIIKTGLEKNIDRFSRNINYSDPEVLGKATNLSINTRTKPIDNGANDFADIIEMAILDLIKVCNGIWNKTKTAIDPYLIDIQFSYDKPANLPEEAMSVQTLVNSGVMLADALTIFSGCENPAEWADRAEEARQAKVEEYLMNNREETPDNGNQ